MFKNLTGELIIPDWDSSGNYWILITRWKNGPVCETFYGGNLKTSVKELRRLDRVRRSVFALYTIGGCSVRIKRK